MIRIMAATLAIAGLATAAAAQPMTMSDAQMDRVTAGGLSLSVNTVAAPDVTLPAPLGSTLTVSPAAAVTISIDATARPTITTITHPGN
jgi:hypothetical protein